MCKQIYKVTTFRHSMKASIPYLDKLQDFRKELHRYPEYSGQEKETAARVLKFCNQFEPDNVIEKLGGNGFALVFEGSPDGKTVMLRAELDALPVHESQEINHHSLVKDISHKCGHDGHLVILCGVAGILHKQRPETGRVVLLFEPAEESGKGAKAVIKDPKFQEIKPDYVFALHNVPGFPQGAVVVKSDIMAVASQGLFSRLKGRASHAAYPDQGISPLPALLELQRVLPQLPNTIGELGDQTRVTITYSRLGHFTFGTSPGNAELAATIRAKQDTDIELMKAKIVPMIRDIGNNYSLDTIIQWHERFDSTINDQEAVGIIQAAARTCTFPLVEMNEPFWWSEDFGQFTERFPGAIFGLGAGENHSDLHTANYDFPDEIIEPGIRIFHEIINQLNP